MAIRALEQPWSDGVGRARAAYLAVNVLPFLFTAGLWRALELVSGVDLPVGGLLVAAVALRQLNVFVVTALYHRGYAHGSVRFHPVLDRLLRVWGWLATGLGVRTWALVHRWHHATGDDPEGPFSPSRPGSSLWTVARETLAAHRHGVAHPDDLARYGSEDLPDDRLEAFLHAEERRFFGVRGYRAPVLLALLSLPVWALTPAGPLLALGVALAALPALTLSVLVGSIWLVNGIGHRFGRRNFETRDTSTNVVRQDWLGMGEVLHNNHHARPGSACFAARRGEVDPTWWLLRVGHRIGAVRALRG